MAGYSPLRIVGNKTGLVQEREEFILPNDAYPVLQNAYIWRERILRKQGYRLVGRLQRSVTVSNALTSGSLNLITALSLESTSSIVPGSINLTGSVDGTTYTDPGGTGTLTATGGSGTGGTINYATGVISINSGAGETLSGTIQYYPGLPVMGIRIEESPDSANDATIIFDQKYAYKFNTSTNTYAEFIPGTTWNANGNGVSSTDFFWSTNYWVSATVIPGTMIPFFPGSTGIKLFWVTNNSGAESTPDPIRITDGTTWVNFTPPNFGQIDATNFLVQCLALLPFRGRMLAFNTYEGPALSGATNYYNRIRWSTIGNPFIPYTAAAPPNTPAKGSWRDDIRGQGGFLDIPINEDIISVGFVRDNLVIYCERSTWQLRYTGKSIAPFQIEKVNSELGAQGPFSTVQFDTSLVGIGDKGIVECDSYRSELIDIKIPDFVYYFQGSSSTNESTYRVHGIRDFEKRLAYWTIPLQSLYDGNLSASNQIFPNTRLVYNYENDSWALFSDSLTVLGTYQPLEPSLSWLEIPQTWLEWPYPWINQPGGVPLIIGGNQQGFIEQLDGLDTNDVSLFISGLTQGTTVQVTSPNHNMKTPSNYYNIDFVIGISGIPSGTPFSSLNGGIYAIEVIDANNFYIFGYDSEDNVFDVDITATPSGTYIGGGLINIAENFYVNSKKFNFLDEGQNIQLGYIDLLMTSGSNSIAAIALNVFLNYDTLNPSNAYPNNLINIGSDPDTADDFFNTVIPTTPSSYAVAPQGTKFWQRVYCATRANFLTLQYTFTNAQMASAAQQSTVQIDAQVLWVRKAGRMTSI